MNRDTAFIVFLAPYTQNWGGYTYARGTPRGVGMYVQRNGVDFLFSKTFGAGADIYVGNEASERLGFFDTDRAQVYASAEECEAALPPALGGSWHDETGYARKATGTSSPWYFDHEVLTPDLLVARGTRTLLGRPVRLTEDEVYDLPSSRAERALAAERLEAVRRWMFGAR